MKIIHLPHDHGGTGYKISRAQRKLGHQSDYGSFQLSYFQFPAEYNLQEYRSRFKKASFFLKAVLKYDVFHFHSESLFFNYRDIPLLKKIGKKVIFHFHGSDIRGKKMHPRIKLADAHLVSTPDLLEYVPDGIWIPQPIDLDYWKSLSVEKKERAINIVHAPSHRKKKGTDLILSTIEELKREGYPVKLSLIEGKSYESLKSYYQKGDIFLDQILIGTYGNFSIEGMALKKPVCVFITEEASRLYPEELPVMNISPDNLKQNLIKLIEDEKLRKELGEKGRAYVEKYHEVQKIALMCLSIYQNC